MNPNDILVEDRMRKDYGDVAELAASIKENGLIQPIVLAMVNVSCLLSPDGLGYKLVAGGRRLSAMKLLGWKQIKHGEHFIVRGEDESTPEGKLRLGAIELEENLRRKEMTWPEQVEGKQRLLELMQSIHGGSRGAGAPSLREQAAGETSGFGVRKLAAMLGESPALVSKDLNLARMARSIPQIRNNTSKGVAMTQGIGMILQAAAARGMISKENLAAGQKKLAPMTVKPIEYRVMVFVKDEKEQVALIGELMQRGLKCQPVII